jgi:protein-L-isoaspartate(D-aspartate) O-methyltransferase
MHLTWRWLIISAPVALLVLGMSTAGGLAQEQDPYQKLRLKMVEEFIEKEGVTNEAVLNSMRQVPRHRFVPPKMQANAYMDWIIPMGYKQTVSPPYIVAYMTQAIDPKPTDRVLEIGTGSGYQAAVLAKIVKEVYTIEIVEPLGREATQRLKELGYANVHTKIGDGYKGWPEYAPFDKIIVTCSPENVPQPLKDQLREGGKMIVPLGERFQQAFYLFEKRDGNLVRTKLLSTLFVPMTGMAEAQRKRLPNAVHPRIANGGFEQSTDGRPDIWYYQRQVTLESKHAPEGKTFITFSNREPGRDAHALQGVGVDGARVRSLRLSCWVKAEDIVPGPQGDRPALVVHFYNVDNMPIDKPQVVASWRGTFNWMWTTGEIQVPRETYMVVVRIGLHGATGSVSFDDLKMSSRPR